MDETKREKELDYFLVDGAYGWRQEWFPEYMMRLGGCAAVTACDCCVWLKKYRGLGRLYPGSAEAVTREDYLRLAARMKPYLRPRWRGIDTLDIYRDGFGRYLRDAGETGLALEKLDGGCAPEAAWAALRGQIDGRWPVPCLILSHRDPAFADYVWHWFLLTGYDGGEGPGLVRAVTDGEGKWLDFAALWNTGHSRRGGLILFRESGEREAAE